MLVSQRRVSQVTRALQLGGEHLAVHEGASPLARRLFAVALRHQAVFGCPHTVVGGSRAPLRSQLAPLGGIWDAVAARRFTFAVRALVGATDLGRGHVAGSSSLVPGQRCDIARVRHRVAPLGVLKSSTGPVALARVRDRGESVARPPNRAAGGTI